MGGSGKHASRFPTVARWLTNTGLVSRLPTNTSLYVRPLRSTSVYLDLAGRFSGTTCGSTRRQQVRSSKPIKGFREYGVLDRPESRYFPNYRSIARLPRSSGRSRFARCSTRDCEEEGRVAERREGVEGGRRLERRAREHACGVAAFSREREKCRTDGAFAVGFYFIYIRNR